MVIVSRVVTVLTGLITIPLVSRYLGADLFGFWMILTNFVSFLVFADLGICVGFQNQLIRCYATNNREDPSSWVANALLMMLIISAVMVLVALFVVPWSMTNKFFIDFSSDQEYWMIRPIQSLFISFSIAFPAMLLEYIGNAYQRGYWVYSLIAIGRVVSLIGVCMGCYLKISLSMLICIFIAIPYLFYFIGFIVLWFRIPWLRPCWYGLSVKKIRNLLHVGIGMLGVRITHALSTQGPALMTAHLCGFAEAGIIAVAQKIIEIPSVITQSLVIATQSAMAEAAHKRDWLWVKRNLLNLTKINVVLFIVTTSIVLLIGREGLTRFLGSDAKEPSFALLLLCCMYFGLMRFRFPYGSFLTCIDRVYTQSFYRIFALLSALVISFLYVHTTISIIAVFLLFGEVPQIVCTVSESCWIIYSEKKTL